MLCPEMGRGMESGTSLCRALSSRMATRDHSKVSSTDFWSLYYWETCALLIEKYDLIRYHGVSFSWILGGIVELASGKSFHEIVQERVARPLGMLGEMFIGRLPEEQVPRTSILEVPLLYPERSLRNLSMQTKLAAYIESRSFVSLGSSGTWKGDMTFCVYVVFVVPSELESSLEMIPSLMFQVHACECEKYSPALVIATWHSSEWHSSEWHMWFFYVRLDLASYSDLILYQDYNCRAQTAFSQLVQLLPCMEHSPMGGHWKTVGAYEKHNWVFEMPCCWILLRGAHLTCMTPCSVDVSWNESACSICQTSFLLFILVLVSQVVVWFLQPRCARQ